MKLMFSVRANVKPRKTVTIQRKYFFICPVSLLVRTYRTRCEYMTAMDGGNASFAGAKTCQCTLGVGIHADDSPESTY